MSWQTFLSDLASDARQRAITQLAPLVLRQLGGLLTDTASRLEAYEPEEDYGPTEDFKRTYNVSNRTSGPITIHHHGPTSESSADVIDRLRTLRREGLS